MSGASKKLNTVHFSDIGNWSINAYLKFSENDFKYPQMRIGTFLKRIKQSIDIEDDVYYKRATIKINNGGVYLRDNVIGYSIGTKKQFIINCGQLLLSKIDARNGAFGIVPEELDGGVITGNFWVYEIDTSIILPQVLCAILSSSKFQTVWEACSNGTTNRHYLQEQDFLNTKIPVPSLDEQMEFVNNYNKIIEDRKRAEAQLVLATQDFEKSIFN